MGEKADAAFVEKISNVVDAIMSDCSFFMVVIVRRDGTVASMALLMMFHGVRAFVMVDGEIL